MDLPPRPEAILFDLDGTLIDHFTTIYRAYCHAMAQMGLPPVTYAQVRGAVGGSLPITFGKLVPAECVDAGVRLFRAHYEEIWREDLHALPGTDWVLPAITELGIKVGILTNKEGPAARAIAATLGWNPWMTVVIGRNDTQWVKPAPELSAFTLEKIGATGERSWFIGDSPYDIAAARAGGMTAHVLATGSHTFVELEAEGPDGTFADVNAWAEATLGLTPPQARRSIA